MRVPSDIESIKGTFKSEADGAFVFLFDNSFSWFNSKLLSYTVNLFQVCNTFSTSINHSNVTIALALLYTACIYSRGSEPCASKPPPSAGHDGGYTQSQSATRYC